MLLATLLLLLLLLPNPAAAYTVLNNTDFPDNCDGGGPRAGPGR